MKWIYRIVFVAVIFAATFFVVPTVWSMIISDPLPESTNKVQHHWSDRKDCTVVTWLDVVERSTRKVPIIYTQPGWWHDRVGTTDKLAKYQIWVADYTAKSQLSEVPKKVPGYVGNIWQFSEHGRAKEGFPTKIDVSIFRGAEEEFLMAFGLPK